MEPQDTITIAPSVLITMARHAAMQVNGVSRTGSIPVNMGRLLRGNPMGSGVLLKVDGNNVTVDIYLILLPDASIREVSHNVQQSIARCIEELVGMDVTAVNVHVENVDYDLPI